MAASRWYKHLLRVRYQETDQMGVVYHVNYANWFEVGRTEMIRSLGLPYAELERRGLLLPVTELTVKYRKPARYDDIVAVYTRIASFTNVRMQIESEIRLVERQNAPFLTQEMAVPQDQPAGELLVHGGTSHVWVDRDWRPARIDRTAPDLYELLIRHTSERE